jgi:glycerol-3-phosphate dehydrogenase
MTMDRDVMLRTVNQRREPWDIVVIGGGATGSSIALDAASRGLSVLLVERSDFGKGTSSRSTKLVHGGVRYLAQGNISLVRDALRERGRLARNAPHVVFERSFVVPCSNWLEFAWYRIGFWVYDLLAGKSDYRRSHGMRGSECIERVSTLKPDRARWGGLYSDGQFDDTRLLIDILRTACSLGAVAINYANVDQVVKDDSGNISGLRFVDLETDRAIEVSARCIVNAAGPFCDGVRRLDQPDCEPMVAASQGVHIVLPRSFLPGDTAIIVPKTSDGRVLFLIPWHDRVVVGTTDTPIPDAAIEPRAMEGEIEFLLRTCTDYLVCPPTRSDVMSVFTGIRPLVRPKRERGKTSSISRDHTIDISESGLITITGGKWTTARKMAQDCVDRCIGFRKLHASPCGTENLALARGESGHESPFDPYELTSAHRLVNNQDFDERVVLDCIRNEMARTVEDVLARRTRWLFLDVAAAESMAPRVAEIMARELRRGPEWVSQQLQSFAKTAASFRIPGMTPAEKHSDS